MQKYDHRQIIQEYNLNEQKLTNCIRNMEIPEGNYSLERLQLIQFFITTKQKSKLSHFCWRKAALVVGTWSHILFSVYWAIFRGKVWCFSVKDTEFVYWCSRSTFCILEMKVCVKVELASVIFSTLQVIAHNILPSKLWRIIVLKQRNCLKNNLYQEEPLLQK